MFIRVLIAALGISVAVASAEAGVIDRYAFGAHINHRRAAPSVRVLIVHDAKSALLRVDGKYAIVDPHRHEVLSRRVSGKQRDIVATAHGLKWGEEFPDLFQLKLVPTSPGTIIYVNGNPYSGIVTVYDVDGTVSIVNDVDIEDFVASAMAARIDKPVAKEALAAIAIAQRTEAYYRATFSKNQFWDIDGIKLGYRGVQPRPQYNSAEEAVNATSYMVMNSEAARAKVDTDGTDIGLFPAHWSVEQKAPATDKRSPILILSDAETAAQEGQNAAQILNRVYPGVTVQRVFQVY